ncbi:type I restriction enzyme S subunit [Pseudomonas alcaligenes]|nr:type I restriction enzyme S subunit [Pseudomonas alcaligenes]
MSFPAYPDYKDSGIEWLGEVPAHWKEKPFFSLVSERCESNAGMKHENLLSLSYGRIVNKDINALDGLLPASFETYQVVHPGDIVFRLTDLQNDKRSLRSAIVRETGIITSAYLAGICRGIFPEFASFLFRAYDTIKVFYSMGGGLRQSMKYSDMKWLPVWLPDWQEQTQIARFLDHETTRIDALIEEQQRLIELLKEKRQAVISHAVTKGLDPTVPMKDSGVEWLGEVPAHWEVTKFKWPLRTASGGTPPSNDRETYYDGGIPWLRSLDLTDDLITEYEVTVTQRAVEETACKVVPKSSVLIAMYGGDGTIGKNGLLTFDSAINQAICAFLPSDRCAPEYLHRYIQFYRPYWMIGAESSRKDPNIGQDRIGDHFLVLPPPQEQSEIVAFLGVELLKFSALIKEAQAGVEFLQERRSALISAAVTGKIDVRGWQPPAGTPSPESAIAEAH